MSKFSKILLAVSGGVDSSVSAHLLKQENHRLELIHFLIPNNYDSKNDLDYSKKNLAKVKTLAEKLNLKLHLVDIREDFKNSVIDYLIQSYQQGLTPNPCVICNRRIKFKKLLQLADQLKINYVATGHYAGTVELSLNNKKQFFIQKGIDQNKDQSYFLSKLSHKTIKQLILPLGNQTKQNVYQLAEKFKLKIKKEEESTGLCFLKEAFDQFIQKKIKEKHGDIVDQNDNIIGRHQGLSKYTLGQRKGIEIGGGGPYFVIKKDYLKNILKVSNVGDEPRLFKDKVVVDLSYLSQNRLDFVKNYALKNLKNLSLKIRYGQKNERLKSINFKNHYCEIKLKNKVRAITPGQIAAVYFKDIVLFAGEIL
ncbi:MAG: tRNA 2-thiouridine(34) synthase MnmA [Candidatus Moranbacteria bacterium]|nr:tRNA 2-thiouridine(34) synthase MnmA [Candidatus Moranbacteria bacterium]